MSQDLMNYPGLVEEAMRGVVRAALRVAETDGLPGDHHFYVTFRTAAPGVNIASRLIAQYPDEITIVLQHQFWGLVVDEDAFEVTLSFSGKNERLFVPFTAVTGFADPSANFALQFHVTETDTDADDDSEVFGDGDAAEEPDAASGNAESDGDEKTGEVVTLDSFRKKKT